MIPIIMISAIGEKMGTDYAGEVGSDYVQAEMFLERPQKCVIGSC